MNTAKQMNEAITYIEKHLLEEISLEDISQSIYTSKFHFARMFNFLTGMTVFEYIRNRRLTKAVQDLRKSMRVIDVAYKYGYETPESFSKAFKRLHGVSPSKVKHYTGVLKVVPALSVHLVLKGEEKMEYRIVDKDKIHIVGLKRSITTVDNQNFKLIPAFWDEVMEDGSFQKINKYANDLGTMGVITNYNESSHSFDYYIAIEGQSIEGFDQAVTTEIAPAKYAIFTSKGPLPNSIQDTWQKIYSEFYPATDYKHAGTAEFEVYMTGDSSQEDYECEIWIPIK